MKTLLFLSFLLTTLFSSAQHPSYYTFGEEQFKGVDIYDVIQDSQLNYWFATDQGLMFHDGYSYQKVACPNMKGSSVFGFTKDSKGTIYCHNLHQQIFRIIDGKMEFYFEIPEDLEHHDLYLIVDHEDHLLIQSTAIIRIAPNKSSIEVTKSINKLGSPLNFHLLPDGSTVSATSRSKFIHQKNGKLTEHEIKIDSPSTPHELGFSFSWITIKNRVYVIDNKDLDVFEMDQSEFTFRYVTTLNQARSSQVVRLYHAKDQLWVCGISKGAHVYSEDFEPLFNGEIVYPSTFLSNFLVDVEGNLLLSTFDEGVLVVPNLNVKGYALPEDERILHVASDGHKSLFISTDFGNIYQFKNGKIKLLYSDPAEKSNEGMVYWYEQNTLVSYTFTGAQFSSWDGEKLSSIRQVEGAFKNAHFDSPTSGLIAFNFGVSEIQKTEDGSLKDTLIRALQRRAYCVVRDAKTQSIYTSLSNGLVRYAQSGKLETIKYKGQVVYPNSLLYSDGEIYIGTRKHGILVYENEQFTRRIDYKDVIRKMIIHDDRLFILSNRGLDISSLDGKSIRHLNNSSGLSFNYISEFHISNNTLYITDSKSLQFISLDRLFTESASVPIHFKSIKVNNGLTTKTRFDHEQHKIEFRFGVSTLQFRDNIHYRYKLQGYEKDWQRADYSNNKVTYNALAPGTYSFIVQSVNGSIKSEPITYSFTIDAPYHQKWWFYLLIFLVSGLLMTIFFFYRIRKIRKKNKARLEKQKVQTDLLEFELKALRSQMNPHFIFNSLNSIQDLILKEETDASYDYIVLFADLVRSTLSHSNKDFIEIEKEIEFIEVYLSLEQLRFKEDFEYSINVNEISDIKLPTLLIQPFIENALVHGLIHKEGLKRLSIQFALNDGELSCSIRDNGIGRTKAKEIQKRQGNHESFALNAIEKRLSILNQQMDYECGFVIHDLMENGEAIGTEVVVTLPYKQLY